MLMALRVAILIGSLLGYMTWLYSKRVETAFTPILVISCIGIAMFFAGIFNIMLYAVYVILLGGYVLGFIGYRNATRAGINVWSLHNGVVVGFFVVLAAFFLFRLRDVQVTHYDNFSHWAVIVKELLLTNKLPDADSLMIRFQSYPTGSSGFIYYVCKIVGESEGVMLFGQALILVACVCVFWAFVERRNIFSGLCIFAISAFLFTANISMTDLLVDTLVSLLAMAAFAVVIYYRKNLAIATKCNAILMTYLLLVKNSGVYFLLLHTFLLCMLEISEHQKKTKIKDFVQHVWVSMAVPMLVYFLWTRHVDYVFEAGATAKHSMSVENYMNTLLKKELSDIIEILQLFVQRVFSVTPGTKVLLIIIFVLVFGGVLIAINRGRGIRRTGWYGLWILIAYIGFLCILATMYLLSMPLAEALRLASYDRYVWTATLYMTGVMLIYLLVGISRSEKRFSLAHIQSVLLIAALLVAIKPSLSGLTDFSFDLSGTQRGKLQEIQAEYGLPDGASYYLLTKSDYIYYLARYEYWSPYTRYGLPDEKEKYVEIFNKNTDYDYLIIPEITEATDEFLEANGIPVGEQVYVISDYAG